ncbi:MAG: TIR domain-containing protein, partial [Ruminococcus sp.]|nr:TIR domain-containing protein [Ruminococcus sp.]
NNMKKYKIGVTFTGEYRDTIVFPVCNSLVNYNNYNIKEIFYDEWHQAKIAHISGDEILKKIYHDQCECIVVFLCREYKTKRWTYNIEWESIKSLINTEDEKRILLINLDSMDINTIEGLDSNRDIYIDASKCKNEDGVISVDKIANLINDFYKNMKTT